MVLNKYIGPISEIKILLILFYSILFLNGTFFLVDRSSIYLNLFYIVLIYFLFYNKNEFNFLKKISFNNIKNIKFDLISIFIILFFFFYYFINNLSQEFPFSGDYKLHAENSLNINQFLISSFIADINLKEITSYSFVYLFLNFLISNLALFIYFLLYILIIKLNYFSLFSIIVIHFGLSFLADFNITYPSATYNLSLPFNFIFYLFDNISLMESIRYLNFLSPLIWLLILRPLIIGEKINFNIFILSIFIFWKIEFIFLFSSNYNEPFAIILILLALEASIIRRNLIFVPILVGIATCFKSVNIFFIPFFWILLFPIFYNNKKILINFLLYCVCSLPFLYFYQLTRLTGKVERTIEWNFNILYYDNLNEFLFRLTNIFSYYEILFFLILVSFIFISNKNLYKYYQIFILSIGSLIFFFLYFLDIVSLPWVGYLRFYIYFYILLFSFLLIIEFKRIHYIFSYFTLSSILIMFILNFNDNIKFSNQDDFKKSFIFHYEEPIFLPINKLINIYENNHDISDRIIVIARPNNYIEPIQNTFQYKNYNYEFSQKLQYNCSCFDNKIYLNSFFQKYNLNKNTINQTPIYYKYFGDEKRVDYNFISNEQKLICIKEIEASCDNVYFYSDDTGVLAVISSND